MDLQTVGLTYLNVKNCKDGETIKFISDGEIIKNSFGKNKYSFYVEHNGSQKVMQISAPQIRQLVAILGADSKLWIGKSVTVELRQVTLFDTKAESLALSFKELKSN